MQILHQASAGMLQEQEWPGCLTCGILLMALHCDSGDPRFIFCFQQHTSSFDRVCSTWLFSTSCFYLLLGAGAALAFHIINLSASIRKVDQQAHQKNASNSNKSEDPLPAHTLSSTLCRWVLWHKMPSCSSIAIHSATLRHQAPCEDTEAFPAHPACMDHIINTGDAPVCEGAWRKAKNCVQWQQLLLPPVNTADSMRLPGPRCCFSILHLMAAKGHWTHCPALADRGFYHVSPKELLFHAKCMVKWSEWKNTAGCMYINTHAHTHTHTYIYTARTA